MKTRIKSLYLLASNELAYKLKTIESMNILKDYDPLKDSDNIKNCYKYYRFLGQDLINAQIETNSKIRPDYRYEVYVCKDQDTMTTLEYKPTLRASQIIGHCVPKSPKTEENRITDNHLHVQTRELYEPFKQLVEYTGYWYKIDINSAYPWALATMNKYPELTKEINRIYEVKKSTPKESPIHKCAKLTLNSFFGNFLTPYGKGKLRLGNVKDKDMYWKYDHNYGVAAAEMVSDYLANVKKILEDAGAEVFCKKVDAFIFRAPKDFKIPETIKIGKELGEFKLECYSEYGTIRSKSPAGDSIISTVPSIPSYHNEPETPEEYLLNHIIFKHNKEGLYIKQENIKRGEYK